MMQLHSRPVLRVLAFTSMAVSVFAFSGPVDNVYRGATPAGYNVIQLKPSGALVAILGLFECPRLNGAQHVNQGAESRVVLADGASLNRFPQHFSVRVTASLRKTLVEAPEFTVATDKSPEEFLLGLKFRMQAFDGLDHHVVLPKSVAMIGMPAQVPYDERVYKLDFDVGDRPITSRFLLQVYSPRGEPIGRFTFGLL